MPKRVPELLTRAKLNFWVPADLRERLIDRASREGISLTDLCVELLQAVDDYESVPLKLDKILRELKRLTNRD